MIFGDFEVEEDGSIYDASTMEYVTNDAEQLKYLAEAVIKSKRIYALCVEKEQ